MSGLIEVATQAVDGLGSAFYSGETDVVLALFTDAEDVVYSGSEPGEVAVGKVALKVLLDDLFARDERYCWRTNSVAAVTHGGSLYVVADSDLTVHPVGAGDTVGPAIEHVAYRVTGELERDGSSWRWRKCHGTEPAAG